MDVYSIIKLIGIISFIFLVLTFILGFFKLRIKNRILLHKICAFITLIFGILHGVIVIYFTFFR